MPSAGALIHRACTSRPASVGRAAVAPTAGARGSPRFFVLDHRSVIGIRVLSCPVLSARPGINSIHQSTTSKQPLPDYRVQIGGGSLQPSYLQRVRGAFNNTTTRTAIASPCLPLASSHCTPSLVGSSQHFTRLHAAASRRLAFIHSFTKTARDFTKTQNVDFTGFTPDSTLLGGC